MRKLSKFDVAVGIAILMLLIVLTAWIGNRDRPPRFEILSRLPADFKPGMIHYSFLNERPFEGSNVWIHNSQKSDFHSYLVDLKSNQLKGRILNGHPVLMNEDQSWVLCVRRNPRFTIRSVFGNFLGSISRGKFHPFKDAQSTDIETYFIVHLLDQSTIRLGTLNQSARAGSHFVSSPDFRFAFNKPTGSFDSQEVFILDWKLNSLHTHQIQGWPIHWWDHSRILVRTDGDDLLLYDIHARKTDPLRTAKELRDFLQTNNLPDEFSSIGTFGVWDGKENQVFLTDTHKRWLAVESFLAKFNKESRTLELVTPKFKFEWRDSFDETLTYYVYSGREAGVQSDGVFLRNLKDGSVNTLVEATSNKVHSIPNVYRDKVIYMRDNAMWQIDLNGSNAVKIFPIP